MFPDELVFSFEFVSVFSISLFVVHWMLGGGFPSTEQSKTTTRPSICTISSGCLVNSGASETTQIQIQSNFFNTDKKGTELIVCF